MRPPRLVISDRPFPVAALRICRLAFQASGLHPPMHTQQHMNRTLDRLLRSFRDQGHRLISLSPEVVPFVS